MPRAGQVKPPVQERLSDRIAIEVLTSAYPLGLVDRVVADAGRTQERQRLLPARVVVYFTLAMCLFGQVGYQEVVRLGAGGLAGRAAGSSGGGCHPPLRSSRPARGSALRRSSGCLPRSPGRWPPPRRGGRGVREISRVAGVTNLGVLQDHQAAELAFVLS
jgi:hypothetical protein